MTDPKPTSRTLIDAASSPTLEPAEQLARLWEQGQRIDLDGFLATSGPLSATQLSAVLYVDQHQRWQTGEQPTAENYLRRYPAICSDADAAVDIIFHEFLLREQRGDGPDAQEYAGRFPEYAEMLSSQIAFHGLLRGNESVAPPQDTPTVTLPARNKSPWAGHERIAPDARGGSASSREVQSLLRQRLCIFAVVLALTFLLSVAVVGTTLDGHLGLMPYWLIVAESGLIGALLWSRRQLSMKALRGIEVILMGSVLTFFAWEQAKLFDSGNLLSRAGDGWTDPVVAARGLNWSWAVMIILYGIWIPNTARRSALAVVLMFTVSLAITCALALTAEVAPARAIAGFVLYSTTHTATSAAIAIFGAYRIQTLQRAVLEARKLGPYRLVKRLGTGGMGEVYLAEHALLRRPCALKLIRPDQSGDAQFLTRFEREVQAMATLTHPNTVRVYDYGLATDGTFYYAMEYLPGLSLQELVTRYGPLQPARAVHLLRQVCLALYEAHAIGLVHRDIKPANILAAQVGGNCDVAKLLDFGLVRGQAISDDQPCLTAHGAIFGTPAFMSPEQAAGTVAIDERSDIYSLGALAYFLLTGRPPFVHATSVQTMAAHLSEKVESPRQRRPELPVELEQVVLRCLEKEPTRRFANVTEVEEALASCGGCGGWNSEKAAEWWRTVASQSVALTPCPTPGSRPQSL